jgi:cell division protein FtsW (lipid II flippase)
MSGLNMLQSQAKISPDKAELLLTLLVLLVLFWQSRAFYDDSFSRGNGDRYLLDQALAVKLPDVSDSLASACALRSQESDWQKELCKGAKEGEGANAAKIIANQLQEIQLSFANPLRGDFKEQKREILLARAGSRPMPTVDQSNTAEGDTAGQQTVYRHTYGLENNTEGTLYSRPLACATDWLTSYATQDGHESEARQLAAAVLNGKYKAVKEWAKDAIKLPGFGRSLQCAELGAPQSVLLHAAAMMKNAKASVETAAKASQASALPQRAFRIYAGYALLGLLLLKAGRRPVPLARFLLAGLMLWNLAGWLSRVRLPEGFPESWQSWFFPVMSIIFALLWLLFTLMSRKRRVTRLPGQTLSSRAGYAGFVLLAGLGWWLLLDLSAHGHLKNRFQALYQQTYVLAAFMVVSLLPALRFTLARSMARIYALMMATQAPGFLTGGRRWLPWIIPALMLLLPIAALHHHRQLTSELLRIWFILGVSWFMYIRGESLVRSLLNFSASPLLFSLLSPLALFAGLLVVGQIVTDDFGPLLVTLYGSAVLAGGFTAMLLEEAGRRLSIALPIGMLVTLGWIAAVTVALFTLGPLHGRTAERLSSLKNPFSAANDQMAIIHDFRASIPPGWFHGYGLGVTPWCGEQAGGVCNGVPLQIQSDYTFTALQGVWGVTVSYALLLFVIYWLTHLLKYHGKASSGRPDHASRNIGAQGWNSWIALCWAGLLLAQMAVTVSGNLGWLPLSGVTFPFVSFGAWSLLTNSFFLALAINLLSPEKKS